MYYEFYLDVYFLEDLVMNCLVLSIAGQVQKVRASLWRIVLAGVLGALISCAAVVLPIHRSAVLTALCGLLSCPVMALAAFGRKGRCAFIQMSVSVACFALFLGAIWQILRVEFSVPFAASVPGGYFLARLLWDAWRRMQSRTKYIYEVTLARGGRKIRLKGLLDSGNRLVQPGTLRPVHIADFEEMQKLLSEEETRELAGLLQLKAEQAASGKFTLIPFQSIGNGEGVLPAILLDGICIKHGESAWSTKGVLVAVSKTAVSSRGEYQMILHPHILE